MFLLLNLEPYFLINSALLWSVCGCLESKLSLSCSSFIDLNSLKSFGTFLLDFFLQQHLHKHNKIIIKKRKIPPKAQNKYFWSTLHCFHLQLDPQLETCGPHHWPFSHVLLDSHQIQFEFVIQSEQLDWEHS